MNPQTRARPDEKSSSSKSFTKPSTASSAAFFSGSSPLKRGSVLGVFPPQKSSIIFSVRLVRFPRSLARSVLTRSMNASSE